MCTEPKGQTSPLRFGLRLLQLGVGGFWTITTTPFASTFAFSVTVTLNSSMIFNLESSFSNTMGFALVGARI